MSFVNNRRRIKISLAQRKSKYPVQDPKSRQRQEIFTLDRRPISCKTSEHHAAIIAHRGFPLRSLIAVTSCEGLARSKCQAHSAISCHGDNARMSSPPSTIFWTTVFVESRDKYPIAIYYKFVGHRRRDIYEQTL